MSQKDDSNARNAQQHGGAADDTLSESLEDYLEVILQLERVSRVTRVSEIAEHLKVSRPSVTGALKNLGARGLVVHEPYGHVILTEEGARIAREVERRHIAIRDFLTAVLEVPADTADATACRLEHVMEPEVIARLVSYAEGLENGDEQADAAEGERT